MTGEGGQDMASGEAPGSGPAPSALGRTGAAGRPLLIGLTGPIGCGKSTVAGWLEELGGRRVDADVLAHRVTGPGTPAVEAIRARFGGAIVSTAGVLDRAALGRIVFSDAAALADLEAIVHPAVRVEITAAVAAAGRDGVPFVAIEAIKLVEAGLGALCDEVWLVICSRAAQRARLGGRGVTRDDLDRRMAAQGPDLAARLRPHATRVIDTDGHADAVRRRVQEALEAARAARG
jgi:dephospho-CoA kinase